MLIREWVETPLGSEGVVITERWIIESENSIRTRFVASFVLLLKPQVWYAMQLGS